MSDRDASNNLESDELRGRAHPSAGWVAPLLPVVLVLGFVGVPLLLHYTQKIHNHLDSVDVVFPDGTKTEPGEVYATAVVNVIEHELKSRTGWRPNDFFLWGPRLWADNNANRQRGIIQALRESIRIFKDHLTKVSSDEYDENLLKADNAIRNDENRLWFPSAESKLNEGVRYLRLYIAGLKSEPRTSRPIAKRNVELIRLYQAWTDLLGGSQARLNDDRAGWFDTDDYFYHAQGMAHVMYQLNTAVRREYAADIDPRPALSDLLRDVSADLSRAAEMKPLMIVNGSPTGLLANHRRNVAAYINDARQKMYSVREELEK